MIPSVWVTSLIMYENYSNTKVYASFHVHLRDGLVRKTMSKRRLEDELKSVGSQIRDSVQRFSVLPLPLPPAPVGPGMKDLLGDCRNFCCTSSRSPGIP